MSNNYWRDGEVKDRAMHPPTYLVRRILRKTGSGATVSSYCTLDAILKFDCDETPHGVYNEIVALKLGQVLGVPLASGVLTNTMDGQTFASLQVGSPGLTLPDVLESQLPQVANTYPHESAALLVFDALIGNVDRSNNLKAAVSSPHLRVFTGFDHGVSLLGIEDDPNESLLRLDSEDLLLKAHPFFGLVSQNAIENWGLRISKLSKEQVVECCNFGKAFRGVSLFMQQQLAHVLFKRAGRLCSILADNQQLIRARA